MCDKKLNLKWKSKLKQKWQKEKYNEKLKMKKETRIVLTNVTEEYPMSEEDVRRNNDTKGILKIIEDQRRLTKKKRVPNQWPNHPM